MTTNNEKKIQLVAELLKPHLDIRNPLPFYGMLVGMFLYFCDMSTLPKYADHQEIAVPINDFLMKTNRRRRRDIFRLFHARCLALSRGEFSWNQFGNVEIETEDKP